MEGCFLGFEGPDQCRLIFRQHVGGWNTDSATNMQYFFGPVDYLTVDTFLGWRGRPRPELNFPASWAGAFAVDDNPDDPLGFTPLQRRIFDVATSVAVNVI